MWFTQRTHQYSPGNIMLIMMQRPDATHVAGYHTWKQLARYVKKGEKGIVIVAPMSIRKKDHRASAEADEDRILRFRTAHVFDISQTDGEPLPDVAHVRGNPAGHTERLKTFIARHGIALTYADEFQAAAKLGSADGASCGGQIIVREGLTPAAEFSVLVHELAHETLHRDEGRNRISKKVRETEAEAVAFVVCQAIELDTNTSGSDYIQIYAGDNNTLASSLSRIQKTATAIIAAITPDHGKTGARHRAA
jgi:antirestriction protein ArdC